MTAGRDTANAEALLRNEAERAVKALRYAAHPQPSPNADALAEAIAKYDSSAGTTGRGLLDKMADLIKHANPQSFGWQDSRERTLAEYDRLRAADSQPLTDSERLTEAHHKLDTINEIIFRAENAAMACDVVQPTIKMMSDADIKRIFELSLHE